MTIFSDFYTSSNYSKIYTRQEFSENFFPEGLKFSEIKLSLDQEIDLAKKMGSHPAVTIISKALLKVAINVITEVHGELNGTLNFIEAVSPKLDSNTKGNGVIYADFSPVGSVGWNGINILKVQTEGSSRERFCQFNALIASTFFQETLKKIAIEKKDSGAIKDLIDLTFIREIYNNDNGNFFQYEDFYAIQKNSRIRKDGLLPLETAEDLVLKDELTSMALKFHCQNEINSSHYQKNLLCQSDESVYDFAKKNNINLKEIKIPYGAGKNVWVVREPSKFADEAKVKCLPVLTGPSGSAWWFMRAVKFLSNGLVKELGVSDDLKSLEELMRYVLYTDLVGDQHHSFIEVNMGALTQHDLPSQSLDEIYSNLFSLGCVKGKDFEISNEIIKQFIAEIMHLTLSSSQK